ncbi:MAG: hypothetical protein H7222_15805 [Methylotenera sp.]|nr:hypothetical protein [Oligoflexia bacterium]
MRNLRRVLSPLILGILAISAFLIANSIVTSKRLIGIINSATKDIAVNYTSASGTVLTHFTFKDLEVMGSSSTITWKVNLKEATISVPIAKLLYKTFQTSELVGKGLRFELVFKDAPPATTPEVDDSAENWKIRIGDIQLDEIAEIKLGTYNLPVEGRASLKSAFYFWPGNALEVESTEFKTQTNILNANLKFELEQVDFRKNKGYEFFHKFSCDIDVKGKSPDLGFLNYYFHAVPWLSLEGSDVLVDARFKVDKGLVQPESKGRFEVKNLALEAGQLKALGSGSVRFDSKQLGVHLSDFGVQPYGARGKQLNLDLASSQLDLADPLVHAKKIQVVAKDLVAHVLKSTVFTDVTFSADLANISSNLEELEIPKIDLKLEGLMLEKNEKGSDPSLKGWWGKVSVAKAHLSSGAHPVFSGSSTLSAKDGKPISILLKNAGVLPINLAGLIPMNDLRATTDFHFDSSVNRFTKFDLKSSTIQSDGNLEIKSGSKVGVIKVVNPIRDFELQYTGKDSKIKW